VPTTVHTVRLTLECLPLYKLFGSPWSAYHCTHCLAHLGTARQHYTRLKSFCLLAVPSIVSATVGIIDRGTSYSPYQLGPSLACQHLACNLDTPLYSWINIFFPPNMWKCLTLRELVLWANWQLFVEQNVVLLRIFVSLVFPPVLHLLIYNYAFCQSTLKCYWQLFLKSAVCGQCDMFQDLIFLELCLGG